MPGRVAASAGRPRPRLPRPTAAAWRLAFIALGLLGAAINTGSNLIYLMFSVLVAAVPVSAAVALINLRRARCDLRLPRAPRVGAPYTIEVTVEVTRRRPALRCVELTLLTDRGPLGPVLLERVRPGEPRRVTLSARAARRGPLCIEAVRLRSTFPFGFVRLDRRFPRRDEMLVLPATTSMPARHGRASFLPGGRTLSPRVAGMEYAGLRRGGDQDDVRTVDWKVTARRGETIVRETSGESRREHRLDVTTRWPVETDALETRRRFEEQVSSVGGAARQALEAGGLVRLSVDGAGTETYVGRGALIRVLRRLARLEPTTHDGSSLPHPPIASPDDLPVADARATPQSRALRASSLAALGVGALALFAAEGIGPLALALLVGSIAVVATTDRLVVRRRSIASRVWNTIATLALGGYVLDILVLRRDLLAASLSLTVFITLFALFNARGAEDDRRLLLVSFLHMLLAAALTTDVVLALPLTAWLLATIHALMAWSAAPRNTASGPRRVIGDPAAGRVRYAAPALAVCASMVLASLAVFLAVPHLGTGTFRPGMFRGRSASGFTDRTTLGDIGRIKLDQARVMDVRVSGRVPDEGDLRWRGLALNKFDGRTWTRSYGGYARIRGDDAGRFYPSAGRVAPIEPETLLIQDIRLEPDAASAVFGAASAQVLVSRDFHTLGEDIFGNLEFPGEPGRRLRYSVASRVPPRDPQRLRQASGADPPEVRDLHLALPALDPRIRDLAREITAGAATRYDTVAAIESWLSSRRSYSLDVNDRGAEDPLARFLIDDMPGHCEYFATAMVVLARAQGVPARFVAGYLGGERSDLGDFFVVRQSDAHSWVEVHFPGAGWIPFDPTPAAGRETTEARGLWALGGYLRSSITRVWDDYVVGIDLDDQARGLLALAATARELGSRLGRGGNRIVARQVGPPLVALVAIALLVWAGRRVPRLWRRRERLRADRPDPSALPGFYARALGLLERRGLALRPGETPAELAARAGPSMTALGRERLRELTRLYYQVRFDGVTREQQVARIARALVGDVRGGWLES